MMNSQDKAKAGYKEGFVSICLNTVLFAIKLWAGILVGSIAMTADAWHTLSDSISSIVVVIAVKLSGKKPDKDHPFGHGRWEQIAALFISFLLAIIAFSFAQDSIERLSNKTATEFGTIAIIVTIISIVAKEALAQYAFYIAKKTGNVSIKADGWHHRTDALSSVVVLVGIFFAKYFWWIDAALGLIVSLMLFYASYIIVKEAVTKLLGEEPSAELIENISNDIKTVYSGDLQLHHFHIHNYVTHSELTFHIKLDGNISLEQGHKIATDIEDMIEQKYNITSTIHYEPLNFVHKED